MPAQPRFAADELILILDHVLEQKAGANPSRKALVETLQSLSVHDDRGNEAVFRNEAGVGTAIKHMRAIDESAGDWPPPDASGKPRDWRPHFKLIWQRFHDRPDDRKARVAAILSGAQQLPEADWPDLDEGFVEGGVFYALHRKRERDPRAVRLKKANHPSRCEVCEFDFAAFYGPVGESYIECHHINPLAITGETETKPSDLALVCANCHRMLHRGAPPPTIDELRNLVKQVADSTALLD